MYHHLHPAQIILALVRIRKTSEIIIHIQSYLYRYNLYIARVCLCVCLLWAFAKIYT